MHDQEIIKAIGLAIRAEGDGAIRTQLDLAERTGYEAVELCASACRVIADGKLLKPRLREVVSYLRTRDLLYTVHAPLILNFMDEEHLSRHVDVCRATLEFCNEIGSGILVIHPGWITSSRMLTSLPRLMTVEAGIVRELADVAREYGVLLAMENMPATLSMITRGEDNYGLDPAELAEQIRTIDHPNVCGTLDFSHALISSTYFGVDYHAFIEPFTAHVNHLHVHDSFGRPPSLRHADAGERLAYGMGDLHLPLGWGTVDWETILPRVRVRPGTVMTVEISDEYISEATLTESLETARRHAALLDRVATEDANVAA